MISEFRSQSSQTLLDCDNMITHKTRTNLFHSRQGISQPNKIFVGELQDLINDDNSWSFNEQR